MLHANAVMRAGVGGVNGGVGGVGGSGTGGSGGGGGVWGPSAEGEGEGKGKRRTGAGKRVFQFDVGAYGIPKRGQGRGVRAGVEIENIERERGWEDETGMETGMGMTVQVGEDAYFVREDAMGVADGVGGWSSRKSHLLSSHSSSRSSARSSSRPVSCSVGSSQIGRAHV